MKRVILMMLCSVLLVMEAACASKMVPQQEKGAETQSAAQEDEKPKEFDIRIGGGNEDLLFSIDRTDDGGFIAAGYTVVDASKDCWVVKLAQDGSIEWEKTLGGSGEDRVNCVRQAEDGGYFLACDSDSMEITDAHGGSDGYIVKLSANGETEWEKAVGGSEDDGLIDAVETKDGGYTFVGYTRSTDGDVDEAHKGSCFWQIIVSSDGELTSSRIFEMNHNEMATSVCQTSDGGYVIAGVTSFVGATFSVGSTLDDIKNPELKEIVNALVIKTTAAGEIEWDKSMGNSYFGYSKIIQTNADGYLLAYSASSKGDEGKTLDGYNYWLVMLESGGKVVWSKGFGGSEDDLLYGICQLEDGCFIATGYTLSDDGEVGANNGKKDCWTIGVAADGALLWEQTYGDAGIQSGTCADVCEDGGFVVAGHDDGDAFVFKSVIHQDPSAETGENASAQ